MESTVTNCLSPNLLKGRPSPRQSVLEDGPMKPSSFIDSSGDIGRHDMVLRSSGKAGFSNLPNQIHRKAVQRGFAFNLMITGSPGVGKATFLNALFRADIYNDEYPGPSKCNIVDGTIVRCRSFLACESRVNLKLNILDTPGFGQNVDNSDCWQPIISDIDSRFESYLRSELGVRRVTTGSGSGGYAMLKNDKRVHACLYFLSPNIHNMHKLDIETMKRLHDKVNLIVVIGKADTLTPEECTRLKQMVNDQLTANNIQVYDFPEAVTRLGAGGTDENWLREVLVMRKQQPFAIVSSDRVIEHADGKKVYGRMYPWGIVETENMKHNDFYALKSLLLHVHPQDLIDVTNTKHYGKYFSDRLSSIAEASQFSAQPDASEPLSQLAADRAERMRKLVVMEAEMEAVFEQKVRERSEKLVELERRSKAETEKAAHQLAAETAEFEKKKAAFEEERMAWGSSEPQHDSSEALDAKDKGRTKKKAFFQ